MGATGDNTGAVEAGSVHLFDLDSATPGTSVFSVPNPDAAPHDFFGSAVAITGTKMIVGASLDDTDGDTAGSAYVYELASGIPVLLGRLLHPSAEREYFFGNALDASGGKVVVGGTGSGRVYDLDGETPFAPVGLVAPPDPANPGVFAAAVAISGTTIVAGDDAFSTPIPERGAVFVFDLPDNATTTYAPLLSSPASQSLQGPSVAVSFIVPETALQGSVKLAFNGAATRTLTLAASQESAGEHSFNLPMSALESAAEVAAVEGGASLPDGLYTVTLSYQDTLGNPAGTATATQVTIDSTPLAIGGDFSLRIIFVGTSLGSYLPQAVTVDATSVIQDPPAGTVPGVGILPVTLTAMDAAGHQVSTAFNVSVRALNPVSTSILGVSDPAPGAGTSGGPPADALLSSFGVPAVDEAGAIAFRGKWTSATEGKGTGIFTQMTCVAKVGATFKTLSDPVLGGGHVAFLATLAGVPVAKAAAVLSGPAAAAAVIAQAGTVAPGLDTLPLDGGVTFKGFKGVAVNGESVAILAQLARGLGRASANTDLGLWLKDGTHGLRLVLREGQSVGDRTIKTLVAFAVGNGSPGQGRGWLTQPPADGPRVLALAMFTGPDNAQAVLSVGIDGSVSVVSETGPGGTGAPAISGARFASYGVPSMNASGRSAFLGSLVPGGTVTSANARALFVSDGNSTFTHIARVAKPAGTTGGNFSLLKDPVLSEDHGVAFPATLKGGTLRAPATTTLWWKPAGEELTLLAQGGPRPTGQPIPGLPIGAQWNTFPSLAVAADRGPIFTATLLAGKGGVTAATASGVWAADFTGATRLLFRTGMPDAVVTGKTLKSFTLLNATVGSVGVTRSFNNAGEVVWLATFTDKSTAIIKTTVP
jgi:hypothetical protein